MLLCRLNQQYDQSVSQENPTQQNFHFDWTTAGRTMPPVLVRESANWITKRRNEAHKTQLLYTGDSTSLLIKNN